MVRHILLTHADRFLIQNSSFFKLSPIITLFPFLLSSIVLISFLLFFSKSHPSQTDRKAYNLRFTTGKRKWKAPLRSLEVYYCRKRILFPYFSKGCLFRTNIPCVTTRSFWSAFLCSPQVAELVPAHLFPVSVPLAVGVKEEEELLLSGERKRHEDAPRRIPSSTFLSLSLPPFNSGSLAYF